MGAARGAGKVCAVCGEDCSGKPRTKDNKGRYFCQPCYERAKQSKVSKHASREAVSEPPSLAFGSSVSANLLDQLVAGAPPVQTGAHCPTCGFAMKADAVLCTNCGYNTQTHHAMNTKAYAAQKLSGSGQAWPIVIGVMSIVFGSFGVLLNGGSVVISLMDPQTSENASYGIGRVAGGVLWLSLAIWLLLAGIGICRRQSTAVASIRRWAIVKIVINTLCLGSALLLLTIAASSLRRTNRQFDEIDISIMPLILGVILIATIAWPIFVLVWFGRANVQADISRWRD